MFPACYTEIVKFNFTLIFTLFLSHTVTHTGAQKSWGSITAGGLGDILIPYY